MLCLRFLICKIRIIRTPHLIRWLGGLGELISNKPWVPQAGPVLCMCYHYIIVFVAAVLDWGHFWIQKTGVLWLASYVHSRPGTGNGHIPSLWEREIVCMWWKQESCWWVVRSEGERKSLACCTKSWLGWKRRNWNWGCEGQVGVGARGRREFFLFGVCGLELHVAGHRMQRKDAKRDAFCGWECGRRGYILRSLWKLPDKDILQPGFKVLFLAEPFPLQRMERIQPLNADLGQVNDQIGSHIGFKTRIPVL